MKKEAIEKATTELNPLFKDNPEINWEDDDEILKKLYGLLQEGIPTFYEYYSRNQWFIKGFRDN